MSERDMDRWFTDELTIRISKPDDRGSRVVRAWHGDVLVLEGILDQRRVRVSPARIHSYSCPAGFERGKAAVDEIEALINGLAVGS